MLKAFALLLSTVSLGSIDLDLEPHSAPTPALDAGGADGEDECAPPAPGFLTLETAPWTVVYVDGTYVGSTPLFRQKLAPGAHTLTLVNEARALETSEEITIEEGRARKLKLVLATDASAENAAALDVTKAAVLSADDCILEPETSASLSVDTQPWSRVYVDGHALGSTPLFKQPITAGAHVVRLVRADGKASFARFTATVGETVKLALTL